MNEATYRTVKAVLITVLVIFVSLVSFTYIQNQSERGAEFFCTGAPVVIQEGDTLYWIARMNCDGNFMEAVDRLVKTYGTTLTIGDTIYLPTHNSCELRITDGGQMIEDCK
jgi:hypothetical protein